MEGSNNNEDIAPQIPTSYEGVVAYIKRELECPLPTKAGEKYNALRDKLVGLWREIVKKNSVHEEWYYIYEEEEQQDFELGEEDYEYLRPIAINISKLIKRAKNEFLELTRPLRAIVADESIYAKHIPRFPMETEELRKLAMSTNSSFLFTKITPRVIEKMILQSAEILLEAIISLSNLRFSIICNTDIGITNKGLLTNCLMVEINSGVAHAYPCSTEEATNNIGTFTIQNKDKYDFHYASDEDPDAKETFKLSANYVLE